MEAAQWITTASLVLVLLALLWQIISLPSQRLRPSLKRHEALAAFFAELHRFRSDSDPGTPVLRDVDWLPGSRFAQCLLLDQPLWEGAPESAPSTLARPPRLRKPL
jgi:hypothetical protein